MMCCFSCLTSESSFHSGTCETGRPYGADTLARSSTFGLSHRPLGQAELSVTGAGSLQVSNLESSGIDGVTIELGETAGVIPEIEFAPEDVQPGAVLVAETFGTVDGVPGQRAGTMTVQEVDSRVILTPDFSALGSDTYTMVLMRDGVEVFSQSGMSGPAGSLPTQLSARRSKICCRVLLYSFPIGQGKDREPIPFSLSPTTTILTDNIFFQHANTDRVSAFSALNVQTIGITKFNIIDEEISVFGPFLEHRALGGAALVANNGTLVVSDIDSAGGSYGVSIDVAQPIPSNSQVLTWAFDSPDDPTTLPNGASRVTSLFGVVGSQRDQLTAQTRFERIGDVIRRSADFSFVGSQTQTIELYLGENLVAKTVGYAGPGIDYFISPSSSQQTFTMETYMYRRNSSLKSCTRTSSIAIDVSVVDDLAAGLVDRIVILPENATVVVNGMTSVRFNASGLPKMTFLDQQVVSVSDEVLGSSISGQVLEDVDLNGSGDIPIALSSMTLIDVSGVVVGTTLTDSSGDFSFDAPAGRYNVVVVASPQYVALSDTDGGDPNTIEVDTTQAGGDSSNLLFVYRDIA